MDKLQRKQIKDKIESIPLEDIDFTILYTFPFKDPMVRWVYDNSDNFIFQFEFNNDETQKQTIQILNGDLIPSKPNKFIHKNGQIFYIDGDDEKLFITIRGWGNLTGTGSYNLDGNYAAKIQDTLTEFIIKKLTYVG